ncbi:MAG: PAAR domain-containing protein [Pyrinomonadaceae bacterium]|nr:PAAR domain-containing protein [Pyrinomonadaceae bacterium]
MPAAARLTDLVNCPAFLGSVPHVGGPVIAPCSPNVIIGFLPAARVGDLSSCAGGPGSIATGSKTVLINFMQAARMTDIAGHGGVIISGEPTVIIGG